MARGYRFLILAVPLIVPSPCWACEPVIPFMQVMEPTKGWATRHPLPSL